MEQFAPELLVIERHCAQTAFSILHTFRQHDYSGSTSDTATIQIVSARVDGLREDMSQPQTSLRLRASQTLSVGELSCRFGDCESGDCEHYDGDRDCAAVVLELGTAKNENFVHDGDFDWQSQIAIIASSSIEEGLYDVYICNAKTGQQLQDAEITELMFLLSHIQQNLLIINEEELALTAQSLGRTVMQYYDFDDDDDGAIVMHEPVFFEVTDKF